jgi:plasmid stability protein
MARTTLAIEEGLLRRLKQRAADEGRTLQAVANDLLRQGLARPGKRSPFKLELRGWSAEELPGVDIRDRDALYDVMNGRKA